jgi:hypothetical protein
MKPVATLAALSVLAVTGTANAQYVDPSACETRRPSDPCDADTAHVVVVAPAAEEPTGFARRGAPRTHGLAFETGHLLEPGTFQVSARAYGMFTQVGVGLHERIELSADLVGFWLVGAGAGARVSLTDPASKLRAAIGAKIWALTFSPLKPVQVSGTLAIQEDRVNIHANVSEMPTENDRLWLGSVGFLYELTPLVSIGADIGRVATGTDGFNGVIGGVKLTSDGFDMDIAVAANEEGAVPLLGITGRL